MNDYVRIPVEQISVFDEIVELVGMPEPSKQTSDELIGPYMLGCRSGFVMYHADDASWSWVSGSRMFVNSDDIDGLTEENRLKMIEVFDEVKEYPPIALPEDRSKVTLGRPFICNDWRFAWAFMPELKRWELAPLGRA